MRVEFKAAEGTVQQHPKDTLKQKTLQQAGLRRVPVQRSFPLEQEAKIG